ncbi:MAG: hypothetical protein IPM29_24420 [Planctomycetes bacterium]|nr:hypothetical protein [Planctomycetota bacterium]
MSCTRPLTLAFSAAALLAPVATGQAGYLDSSFGHGGLVTTGLMGPGSENPSDLAVVARGNNGDLVVTGAAEGVDGLPRWFVARFRSDGTPDPSFGDGGSVATPVPAQSGYGTTPPPLTVQFDGDAIIVAGRLANTWFPGSGHVAVVRYQRDGTLDPRFGDGGTATISLEPGGIGFGLQAALVSRGRVLLGHSRNGDFAVLALAADGTVDPTFGSAGIVTHDLGGGYDLPTHMLLDSGGNVVLVGVSHVSGQQSLAAVRLLADGGLDPSFGSGGIALTTQANGMSVHGAAATPDGGLAMLVARWGIGGTQWSVVRLDARGSLLADFPVSVQGTADLAVQDDGMILLSETGDARSFRAARYTPQGALDPSFGVGGRAVVPAAQIGALWASSTGIAASAGVGVLVLGSRTATSTSDLDFAVVRLSATGSHDRTYAGGAGFASVETSLPQTDQGMDLAVLQGDGKLLVLGNSGGQANSYSLLARYDAYGSLDGSFGLGGIQPLPGDDIEWSGGRALAVQSTGRILVGCVSRIGRLNSGETDLVIVGFDPWGRLDPTFGAAGYAFVDRPGGDDNLWRLAVLPDDRVVVFGAHGTGTPSAGWKQFPLVARLLPDGAADHGFCNSGSVVLGTLAQSPNVAGGAVYPDGRIFVAAWGFGANSTTYELLIGLLQPDGTNGGLMPTGRTGRDFGPAAIDDLGRVLLGVGRASPNWSVLRFLPNGAFDAVTLDSTFGTNGTATMDVGGFTGCQDLVVQGDRKVLGIGRVGADFGLVRWNEDGTPDLGFGTGGVAVADFGPDSWAATGVIQGDGRIVLVGVVTTPNYGSDIALARFHGITTPAAVVQELVPIVQSFVELGLLSHTASKSLQSKLEASLQQVENGNPTAALNQLDAFLNQIGALVQSGRLDTTHASVLNSWAVMAQTLIANG